MYRTVTLTLCLLVVASLILGIAGLIPYSFSQQIISLGVVLVTGITTNKLFSHLYRIPVNHESAVITSLIIFFLIIPSATLSGQWVIAAVACIAIASKFIIAWRKQHLFNPAAFGALALSAPNITEAAWWIGTPWLFVPLLIAGYLVVAKIRKGALVLWCTGTAFTVYIFETWRLGSDVLSSIPTFFLSWPLLFLAFFMLTEPFTMPPTKRLQIYYGMIVGGLSSTAFLAPYILISPELALIIGNLLFYPFTLRRKLHLQLISMKDIAKNTKELIFSKPDGMRFRAGQYLEWMLPHNKPDNRGMRRYFTILSAPHEKVLRIAVRFTAKASSYKEALRQLKPNDTIIASQRGGDFILPEDPNTKLAFIAGGIGITPFISHFGHITHQGTKRDITLFYANPTSQDIAYHQTFNDLANQGHCTVVHILEKEKKEGYEHGFITEEIIKKHTPDYKQRRWYLSGPSGMVYAYTTLLKKMKVPPKNIIKDFFPGLA